MIHIGHFIEGVMYSRELKRQVSYLNRVSIFDSKGNILMVFKSLGEGVRS